MKDRLRFRELDPIAKATAIIVLTIGGAVALAVVVAAVALSWKVIARAL